MNKLWIKFFCQQVGIDEFGNRYFLGKNKNYLGHKKRFIIYNGIDDGSKVPAIWHSWLHYLTSKIPEKHKDKAYNWQKKHIPNLTGTNYAYNPNAPSNVKGATTHTRWTPRRI